VRAASRASAGTETMAVSMAENQGFNNVRNIMSHLIGLRLVHIEQHAPENGERATNPQHPSQAGCHGFDPRLSEEQGLRCRRRIIALYNTQQANGQQATFSSSTVTSWFLIEMGGT
jgi:hypothetical protein